MATEEVLVQPETIAIRHAFEKAIAAPSTKDPTGKLTKQVSPEFILGNTPYRLEYVFDDSQTDNDIGKAIVNLVSSSGELIGNNTLSFGKTGEREIMVTPNLKIEEQFRGRKFGTLLASISEMVGMHTIESHKRFAHKTVIGIVFDAATISGWSSNQAAEHGLKKMGENIWIKTYQKAS